MNYYIISIFRGGARIKIVSINCQNIDEAINQSNEIINDLKAKDASDNYTFEIEFVGSRRDRDNDNKHIGSL